MLDYDDRMRNKNRRAVQRFEKLNIWELTFPKGAIWLDHYPHRFDATHKVANDYQWRTKPYVFFVREGAFHMKTTLGREYQIAPPNPPRKWHPGQEFVLTALKPNSVLVCISDKDLTKPNMWERERRAMTTAETRTIPARSKHQYLYLCSGELTLPYGTLNESNRIYQIPINMELTITAESDVDYLHLYDPKPFVPEFTNEAPAYVQTYEVTPQETT